MKLNADMSVRLNRLHDELKCLREGAVRGIPSEKASACFMEARKGAVFLAGGDGLCGWRACAKLACKLACDQVKGTDSAERTVAEMMDRHVLAFLAAGVKENENSVRECRRRAYDALMSFSADCCMRMRTYETEIAVGLPQATADEEARRLAESERAFTAMVGERALSAGGVALSVAFMKSTCVTLKRGLLKLMAAHLARLVSRNVSSATIAGISAAADGPLPIGDIAGGAIEVVGLVWTAYDLYKVTRILPAEVTAHLTGAVDAIEKDSYDACRRELETVGVDEEKSCAQSVMDFLKGETE